MTKLPPSGAASDAAADPRDPRDPRQKLESLLAEIWKRSKQMEIERVDVLRQAQTLAAQGKLDEAARQRAVEAAHKLAGALGTFGLPRGTELAREAEVEFRREILTEDAIERLRVLVGDLDAVVHSAGPLARAAAPQA